MSTSQRWRLELGGHEVCTGGFALPRSRSRPFSASLSPSPPPRRLECAAESQPASQPCAPAHGTNHPRRGGCLRAPLWPTFAHPALSSRPPALGLALPSPDPRRGASSSPGQAPFVQRGECARPLSPAPLARAPFSLSPLRSLARSLRSCFVSSIRVTGRKWRELKAKRGRCTPGGGLESQRGI